MFSLSAILFCCLATLVAGFIDAIAGGGGLITLPALLLAGAPPHVALSCNKFAATLGTTVALGNFARSGLVNWRLVAVGVGFSLAGSVAGAELALHLDPAILGKILVVLLPFAMAVSMLPKKDQGLPMVSGGPRFFVMAPLCCFLVGAYDGFFGPGTGTFLILALHMLVREPLLQASATSKALNLASNAGALGAFLFGGHMVWEMAIPLAAACIAGNWLGSRLAIRVGAAAVRKFLVVSLAILMISLIWTHFLNA